MYQIYYNRLRMGYIGYLDCIEYASGNIDISRIHMAVQQRLTHAAIRRQNANHIQRHSKNSENEYLFLYRSIRRPSLSAWHVPRALNA